MQKLLLNWIYMLCVMGGMVNAVSILKYSHTVSHFTGYVSKMAISLGNKDFIQFFNFIMVMISFMVGSTIAGYMVDKREFSLRRRYGASMVILGIFLIVLYFFLGKSLLFFYYLPFMIGIQNGLFISYNGVVVRTSHITGSITDIGVYIGHILRGQKEDKWKLYFCFFIVISFFGGGLAGLILFTIFKGIVFYMIGLIYIAIGVIYFYLRYRYRNVLHYTDDNYCFKTRN